jgi:abortive infection bacteriophage resistance protein
VSWFRSLNMLRNMCAHHDRLWNFHMVVDQPRAAKRFRSEMARTDRFYARAIVIVALLDAIAHDSEWKRRLIALVERHPAVPVAAMGFPPDWRRRAIWL